MTDWIAITQTVARQYGLLERGQAAQLGLVASTLNRRAAREGWTRVHPGVLALPGSMDGPERRILAAVLATYGESWATRWSAAYLWGLQDRLRHPVTVVVAHQQRAARLVGVKTLRSRTLAPDDLTLRLGIPCVTPLRLLGDLAAVSELPALRGLAIDARRQKLLDPARLWELWERMRPVRGHRRLWRLAMELAGDEVLLDSALEWRMRGLARRAGLAEPHAGPYPVRQGGRVVARIDIAWPEALVGVECDGFRYHSQRRQLDIDSARQNRLVTLGWRLLRVTWAQVENAPESIVSELRSLLEAAGASRPAQGAP